jgi:hypothetical protein
MANGIAQLAVGLALASAIGGSVALTPVQRPDPDVAFLERVASAIEQAPPTAPKLRGRVSELANRHQNRLPDARLELRRQEALERITVAIQLADLAAPALSDGRARR